MSSSTSAAAGGGDLIHDEGVNHALQFHFDHTQDVEQLLEVARKLLASKNFEAVHAFAAQAHEKLQILENARRTRDLRMKDLTEALTTKAFDKKLTLERDLYQMLPAYVKRTEQAHQQLVLSISQVALSAALTKRSDAKALQVVDRKVGIIDLETLDDEVLTVVRRCLNYVRAPAGVVTLLQQLSAEGLPELVVELGPTCLESIEKLRTEYQQRSTLMHELAVLEQEKERLKPIKKHMPDTQWNRYKQLRLAKAEIARNPVPSYDPQSFQGYDQLTFQLISAILQSLFDARDALGKNLENRNWKPTKKEDRQRTLRYSQWIEQAMGWAFGPNRIEDPNQMIQLAELLNSRKQYSAVLDVAVKVRHRIKQLETFKKEWAAQSVVLQALTQEREQLYKQWKLPEADKWHQLWQLEHQKLIYNSYPGYYWTSFDYLYLNISKLMLTAVIDMKQQNKETEMSEDTSRKVQAIMDEVDDPQQLCELARHIEKRDESEIVIRLGEKCQRNIKEVEDLRLIRAPLTRELLELETEQQKLAKDKKHLPPSQQARLKELQEQIAQLPAWPVYGNVLDPHQYDNLSLDVVRVMTSAILDTKSALEKRIAEMFRKQDPKTIDRKKIERDRQDIKNRINTMVQLCLQKFDNPSYLLKFAKDMRKRKEAEVVLQIVDKAIARINDIDEERQRRYPLVKLIADIREEEKKLFAASKKKLDDEKLKQLQDAEDQLAALPTWPHFAQVHNYHQYDRDRSRVIQTAFKAVIEAKEALEQQIATERFNKSASMMAIEGLDEGGDHSIEKKFGEQKQKVQSWVDHAVKLALTNVRDPEHLVKLVKLAKRKKEIKIAQEVAKNCYNRIAGLEQMREHKDAVAEHIALLQEERTELVAKKKTLDAPQAKNLTELEAQLAAVQPLPQFLSTADEHDDMSNRVTTLLLDATLEKAAELDAKKRGEEVTFEQIDAFETEKQELLETTMTLAKNYTRNPQTMVKFLRRLRDSKQFDFAVQMGDQCRLRLFELAQYRLETQQQEKQRDKLLALKEVTDRQRKSLPIEQTDALREVLLVLRIKAQQPSYFGTSIDYHALNHNLTVEMVETVLQKRKHWEDSIAMNDDLSADDIEVQRKYLTELLANVVKNCLLNIRDIPTLIRLATDLKGKLQYDLVVAVGLHCEEIIADIKQEIEHQEQLRAHHKELEQQILLFSIASADTKPKEKREVIEQRLQESKARIDALAPIEVDNTTLDAYTLQITDLIMDAAKIEGLDDVLRDQAILAFKTDVKTERWDQVRDLCSEEEWASIKQDLVIYVLKQEASNVRAKIELLMKDGLYAQCITIFPSPSGEAGEMELLEQLWKELERNQPTALDQLLGTVSRYMKRYYQEFRHEEVDGLLDRVQLHFPAVMSTLLAAATDMMLLNILPSQYNQFVACLKSFKRRLNGVLNRPQDWDEFFTNFKKKHRGKKRLIQMASLIGDSSWDIGALMANRKLKREKPEPPSDDFGASPSSSSSKAKAPKAAAKKPVLAPRPKSTRAAKKRKLADDEVDTSALVGLEEERDEAEEEREALGMEEGESEYQEEPAAAAEDEEDY